MGRRFGRSGAVSFRTGFPEGGRQNLSPWLRRAAALLVLVGGAASAAAVLAMPSPTPAWPSGAARAPSGEIGRAHV